MSDSLADASGCHTTSGCCGPLADRSRRLWRRFLVFIGVTGLLGCGQAVDQTPRPSGPVVAVGNDGFNPVTVIRKPFRAITDAPTMSADEADEKLRPNELVLGVQIGDEARAYPINMLTGPSREIINDTLGGRAIAATW